MSKRSINAIGGIDDVGLRRYALSTLVNALLKTKKPVPFEFLINGIFLHTSIGEYLTANGISGETILTVEYVLASIPPLHLASFEQDDWVSSVDVLSHTSPVGQCGQNGARLAAGQARILSGGFDGILRVWNMSSNVMATSPSMNDGGHTASIKDAKFLSQTQVVSSSLDRTIRIWKYIEDPQGLTATLTPQVELYGHKASIDSVAVHYPSSRILSASADHSVRLWSIRKSDAPGALNSLLPQNSTLSSKRRKQSTNTSTPQRGPLSLLKGHSGPVSSICFAPNDVTVAHSASWDHTFRTWDLPTASLVDTRTTSHALLSLAALPSLNLLAVGTSARHITLIDPRASVSSVSAMTLRGHRNAVVSLACDPQSIYGLLSGSHDGTCRIWDVRSSRSENDGLVVDSLYTISREIMKDATRRPAGEGIKVFGVCWNQDIGIVSGGEDKRIQINRGQDVLGNNQVDRR